MPPHQPQQKRPLTQGKALRVTPVYGDHHDHPTGPSAAAALLRRRFPVALGRRELCGLWWRHCPNRCRRTPANSGGDAAAVCARYCRNLRKVVDGDKAMATDDATTTTTATHPRRPQRNYELLSRRSLEVSSDGSCRVVAHHRQLFRLTGRLSHRAGADLRVAGPAELWMRFRLELVTDKNLSHGGEGDAVSLSDAGDEPDDGGDSDGDAALHRLRRGDSSSDSKSSNEVSHMTTTNRLLSWEARKLAMEAMAHPEKDDWLHAPIKGPAKCRKRSHTVYRLEDSLSSAASADAVPSPRELLSQDTEQEPEADVLRSLSRTPARDSPARRNLFPSPEDKDGNVAKVNDLGLVGTLSDQSFGFNTQAMTVVRRDMPGSPPVKVVTPDLDQSKKSKRDDRNTQLQVPAINNATSIDERLQCRQEDDDTIEEYDSSASPVLGKALNSQCHEDDKPHQSFDSRRTQNIPLHVEQLDNTKVDPTVSPGMDPLQPGTTARILRRQPLRRPTANMAPAAAPPLTAESFLDVRLNGSAESLEATENAEARLRELSQAPPRTSTVVRGVPDPKQRLISNAVVTDLTRHHAAARPGSFRRAMIGAVLHLHGAAAGAPAADNEGAAMVAQAPSLLLPALLRRNNRWAEGERYL